MDILIFNLWTVVIIVHLCNVLYIHVVNFCTVVIIFHLWTVQPTVNYGLLYLLFIYGLFNLQLIMDCCIYCSFMEFSS